MWLEVYISKRPGVPVDLRKLAAELGLSWGIIHYKAVLDPGRSGHYIRVYDPTYLGQTIEVHQESGSVELSLNFPAAPYDVELFFRLTEHICRAVGAARFYMDTVPIPVAEVPDVIRFYQDNTGEVIAQLCREFSGGERKSYTVYATRFPIVLGAPEFREIGGDLYRFAFLIDRLQRTEAEYPAPDVLTYGRRCYGVYALPVGRPVVLPEDPETLVNTQGLSLAGWTVNFGRTDLLFADFLSHAPAGERFDARHRVLTLTEEDAARLTAEFGFDTAAWKVTGKPGWGLSLLDGNYHAAKVADKHLDADPIQAYNHAAVLLGWCARNGLLNETLLREYPELPGRLMAERDDLRPLVREHPAFLGRLCRYHLNDLGRAFVTAFCDADWEGYPGAVDHYAEARLGTERYHCPEYQDEAFLFVPFDEAYRAAMNQCIDDAWAAFCRKNRKSQKNPQPLG